MCTKHDSHHLATVEQCQYTNIFVSSDLKDRLSANQTVDLIKDNSLFQDQPTYTTHTHTLTPPLLVKLHITVIYDRFYQRIN